MSAEVYLVATGKIHEPAPSDKPPVDVDAGLVWRACIAAETGLEVRRKVVEQFRALRGEQYAPQHKLADLVLELADAVENAHDDIGGSRPQLTILREAVAEARRVKGAA